MPDATDPRRFSVMDTGGRRKLKLPMYGSTTVVTQNSSPEDALSALDNALAGTIFTPGDIVLMAFPITSPLNMRAGFLECDGSELIPGTYTDLFAKIQYKWGTGAGINFLLPDLRGKFIRIWDDGIAGTPALVDPGRVFGQSQGYAMENHLHYLGLCATSAFPGPNAIACVGAPPANASTGQISSGATIAAEMRPVNETIYALIKY